jgi:hypothetical protein
MRIAGGSAAPTALGLKPSPIRLVAPAEIRLTAPAVVAIKIAAATIISTARAMPAHTLSTTKAALVEAWTIPAIDVKAEPDVLDRRERFGRQTGSHRRAQRRRLDTARHERARRQDGRGRSKGQKNTTHSIDPPWIESPGHGSTRSRGSTPSAPVSFRESMHKVIERRSVSEQFCSDPARSMQLGCRRQLKSFTTCEHVIQLFTRNIGSICSPPL